MHNIISFMTKFGWLSIEENNNHLISVSFGKNKEKGSAKNLIKIKKYFISYFDGNKVTNKFKLQIKGSKLQKNIFKELRKISYGKTKSYGDIAKKVHTSPRYVGRVCGQNKYLIIVPCHRVIRNDGKMGGYSAIGGLKLKKRLLNLEYLNKK